MIAHGSGDDDDIVEGDFTPTPMNEEQLSITLELFRYQPEHAHQGWDTIECLVPAHASLQDLFLNVQHNVDGSFTFRRGNYAGSPTTGVRANGRIVLSDMTRVDALVKNGGVLKIEPLPGHPIVRDLVVDMAHFERHRSRAEPWMRTDDRVGEYLSNGTAMGTMESSTALALHQMNSVHSFQYLQGMSETLPHDPHYEGRAFIFNNGFDAATHVRVKSNDKFYFNPSTMSMEFGVRQTLQVLHVKEKMGLPPLKHFTECVPHCLLNSNTLVNMDGSSNGMAEV